MYVRARTREKDLPITSSSLSFPKIVGVKDTRAVAADAEGDWEISSETITLYQKCTLHQLITLAIPDRNENFSYAHY